MEFKSAEMKSKERKAADTTVVEVNERTVTGIVSVFGVKDSYNDIIKKGAFVKTIKENLGRIKHLWQHNWSAPPIATVKALYEGGKSKLPKSVRDAFPDATGGLFITREYLPTPRGDEILAGIKSDPPAINEMSIGYDAVEVKYEKDDDGNVTRILKQVRLWDSSDVNWGANAATVAQKTVIPFKQTPKAPIDNLWDEMTEKESAAVENLKFMCAFDCKLPDEDDKRGYALIHHHNDDQFAVNLAGVKEAMSQLIEMSTGTFLPDDCRKGVYDHLAGHYKQFDLEPPDFNVIDLAYQAKLLISNGLDPKAVEPIIKHAEKLVLAEPVSPLTISSESLLAIKARHNMAARLI
jgi:HK97 family phage prohead protease